jgi:peptidoglycan/xylan/chitin deacetylase (PgdA/CDA1 family)
MPHHIRLSGSFVRSFATAALVLAALVLALPGSAPAAENRAYVLCYHSFLGNKFPSDITMDEFRSQLEFMKSKGFTFITYTDLVKGTVTGSQNILVVIDDGNHSVLQAYHEILKPLGIKPLLAIYPNIISKKPYALTWEQLNALRKEGCEIAAHGYYHELMNEKFYNKDKKEFIHEITGSKATLEKMLPGAKVTAFVYPNGVRAEITKKILRESGYAYAFTIQWGAALSPLVENRDPLEIPRYMIMKGNWKMISSAILKSSAN